jgi:hypothetical protein
LALAALALVDFAFTGLGFVFTDLTFVVLVFAFNALAFLAMLASYPLYVSYPRVDRGFTCLSLLP